MSTVEEVLGVAIAHHQAGRMREAEAAYRSALQMQPNHAQAWYLFGGLAYQLGNVDAACQSLERAAALSPRYWFDLGLLCLELGKLETAADCLQRFLGVHPEAAEACLRLGVVFQRLGRLDEAADTL